jgi:Ser/Thr protein kinase RdoA (MazF antagonist)
MQPVKNSERYQSLSRSAASAYGLDVARYLPTMGGYRNVIQPVEMADGSIVCLIFYKTEVGALERIRRANLVATHLAQSGLPARHQSDSRILRIRSDHNTRYVGLYHFMPGNTIAWEAYTRHHLKQLGAVMARMHHALAAIEPAPALSTHLQADVLLEVIDDMGSYWNRVGVRSAMRRKLGIEVDTAMLDGFEKLVRTASALPGAQVLHLDLVRGNVLFSSSVHQDDSASISGILDFEKTAYGPVEFDIARTMAFLFVDCAAKTEAEIRKQFLGSGYYRRGGGRSVSIQHLDALIGLYLLYDFYKLLLHNPYEDLPDNFHFRRTAAALKRRNIISFSLASMLY